jgi:hypothetical protein
MNPLFNKRRYLSLGGFDAARGTLRKRTKFSRRLSEKLPDECQNRVWLKQTRYHIVVEVTPADRPYGNDALYRERAPYVGFPQPDLINRLLLVL